MRLSTLHVRSLAFHWRTNLAVMLGSAVGTAALTGALLVGDSMRGSLREVVLGRLGRVDHALLSNRFFREALAFDIAESEGFKARFAGIAPVILVRGAATHAETQTRAGGIDLLGVDDRFWDLKGDRVAFLMPAQTGRSVVLNKPLATDLGAVTGDELILRIGKPSTVATETLLGRRNDTTTMLRLTVRGVIPAEDLGAFSVKPRQFLPRNAYIPLATLQRALGRREGVNTMLVAGAARGMYSPPDEIDSLGDLLEANVTLADLGLLLRVDETHGYFALESQALLIEPAIEEAALEAAEDLDIGASRALTYLANSITKTPSQGSSTTVATIPYSTVTAIELTGSARPLLDLARGGAIATLESGEILLNEWAADDLGARPGDRITLTYYITGPFARLETTRSSFTLRGVVALRGAAADPNWTPPYKGITDTDNLADWDPPFPMDLSAVRAKDEVYWDEHGATPKAFISLADGMRLWTKESARFGRLTSLRLSRAKSATLAETAEVFTRALLQRINLGRLDLTFEPVRARMTAASQGTTDFGGLFIGFSFFLIASAAMLVALLFRLSVEQRSGETGLFIALGFTPRAVARILVTQGAVLAGVGTILGLVGALGYASFMLTGLRSWWANAANMPFLRLHGSSTSFAIGFAAGFLLALISIAWSIRGLSRHSPRSLLAGTVSAGRDVTTRGRRRLATFTVIAAVLTAALFVGLSTATDVVPQSMAFFISGAAMLVACLAAFSRALRGEAGISNQRSVVHQPGGVALTRLGVRNARRHRGRSILTAGLIASATFLIVALEAFRLDVDGAEGLHHSGTGGFALFAESAVPLLYDLNTRDGREALNVAPESNGLLEGVTVMPFRLRPGDELSCLNLYKPTKPRILGATDEMLRRGGFLFASTLAESEGELRNPWTLLKRTFPDGAVPVIGDESALTWQLHVGLGEDLNVTDGRGRDVRFRVVALLAGSVLQDELVVAESHFADLFPSISGHGFFLIDVPPDAASTVSRTLERELGAFAFDVGSTAVRLADYLAVQNTYLSTFQMLGGFGLVLGTVGLAAVMLRNVWERRGELALLRALGFSRAAVGWIVLAENAMLLVVGLSAGALSALLATAPHIATRPAGIPWLSLGLTLAAVLATGLIAGVVAVIPTLRAPLLPALRAE